MKINKKAISLIVLVITIIVMLIISGAVVLTLSNVGIIKRSEDTVDQYNLTQVQSLAATKWSEAYTNNKRTQQELETEVLNGLKNEGIDIKLYEIIVTKKGVTVYQLLGGDGKWVRATVDGVPIPKGFTASSATGENTKNGGLVIYEGIEPVTDTNVETARRTRNQYVWVPVDDFSKFVRGAYGNTTYSNVLGTSYWEVILDLNTNMPDIEANKLRSAYMTMVTPSGGITNTLAEVQAMYESVKEYKGFYIARYEAGIKIPRTESGANTLLKGTSVYSVMNKIPYNNVRWTYNDAMNEDTNGAVEVARSMYPETNANYGVVSTLTYGVQWDRTLAWWVETKATNGTGDAIIDDNTDLNDSTNYGNYIDNAISAFNEGARVSKDSGQTYTVIDSTYSKTANQPCFLTTGATEETRVNNIYDMAGNLWEWTMEGGGNGKRVVRGGSLGNYGDVSVNVRISHAPNDVYGGRGFRSALYIKK